MVLLREAILLVQGLLEEGIGKVASENQKG